MACEVRDAHCRGSNTRPNGPNLRAKHARCKHCGRECCTHCCVKVHTTDFYGRLCLPCATADGQGDLVERHIAKLKGRPIERLKEKGIKPWLNKRDREKLLLEISLDLRRVAKLEGRLPGVGPSTRAYDEHGRYGRALILGKLRARGWTRALAKIGLTSPGKLQKAKESEVEDDFHRVQALYRKKTGDVLYIMPMEFYEEHGRHSITTVCKTLSDVTVRKSWPAVADRMHLQARADNRQITRERIKADYARIRRQLKRKAGGPGLTLKEFLPHVSYTHKIPTARFGTWAALVLEMGDIPYKGSRSREGVDMEKGAD